MDRPILIIGGGLAGLACAQKAGSQAILLESEAEVGGLARTQSERGFNFDHTGHWLHFADPSIKNWIEQELQVPLASISRHAEIFSHGTKTPYPFQAHTFGLPVEVVKDCLLGFFGAGSFLGREKIPGGSFADNIRFTLGEGFARHFMLPYNTKLWTVSPEELDWQACARFVPQVTPEVVVAGALSAAGAGSRLGYNANFFYPKSGRISELPERMAKTAQADIWTQAKASQVNWQERKVLLSDGREVPYRKLVTTVPLNELVDLLVGAPLPVLRAAKFLKAVSVTYWNVGFKAEKARSDAHWTYFPEPHLPFYRVGCPSAVLPVLAPAGSRSYYVEVSHPQGTKAPVTDQEILSGLWKCGLLHGQQEPLVFSRQTISCAYVLLDRHHEQATSTILSWLETQGIFGLGRYGRWNYDSMEDAMREGRLLAQKLLSDQGY